VFKDRSRNSKTHFQSTSPKGENIENNVSKAYKYYSIKGNFKGNKVASIKLFIISSFIKKSLKTKTNMQYSLLQEFWRQHYINKPGFLVVDCRESPKTLKIYGKKTYQNFSTSSQN
jgi:hypothetical protein